MTDRIPRSRRNFWICSPRYDAHATFFLIGRYARECPDLVREQVARGHAVGNHTQTHPNLFRTGPSRTRDELRRCQDTIAAAGGRGAAEVFSPALGFAEPVAGKGCRRTRSPHGHVVAASRRLARAHRSMADRSHRSSCRSRSARNDAEGAEGTATASTGDVICVHDGSHDRQNADRSHTSRRARVLAAALA